MKLSIRRLIICATLFFATVPALPAQDYDWAFMGDDGRIYITVHDVNNTDNEFYIPVNFGVLDSTGNVIVDGVNRWVTEVRKKQPKYVAYGEKDKGYGIMDADFNVIVPAGYNELSVFGDYAVARTNAGDDISIFQLPAMKKTGTIPSKYKVLNISDDMIRSFTEEDSFCFFNLSGKTVIPNSILKNYNYVGDFQDGRAEVVDENELMGFIDKKGKPVIPCLYQTSDYDESLNDQGFHNGICAVVKDDMWGIIDRNGKTVVPFIYTNYIDNSGDRIVASNNNSDTGHNEYMIINSAGEILSMLPEDYYNYSDGMVIFEDDITNYSGYKSPEGQIVIPAYFQYVSLCQWLRFNLSERFGFSYR